MFTLNHMCKPGRKLVTTWYAINDMTSSHVDAEHQRTQFCRHASIQQIKHHQSGIRMQSTQRRLGPKTRRRRQRHDARGTKGSDWSIRDKSDWGVPGHVTVWRLHTPVPVTVRVCIVMPPKWCLLACALLACLLAASLLVRVRFLPESAEWQRHCMHVLGWLAGWSVGWYAELS